MEATQRESESRSTEKRVDPKRGLNRPSVPKGTPSHLYPQRMDCATAAQLIDISYQHLRRLTQKGTCPAVYRFGHRVTYDRDQLLAWKPKA